MSINELTMIFEQISIGERINIVQDMEIDYIEEDNVKDMEIDTVVEKKPKRKITIVVRLNKRRSKGPKKSIRKMRR